MSQPRSPCSGASGRPLRDQTLSLDCLARLMRTDIIQTQTRLLMLGLSSAVMLRVSCNAHHELTELGSELPWFVGRQGHPEGQLPPAVQRLLDEHSLQPQRVQVPGLAPGTRQQWRDWSDAHWPLSWRAPVRLLRSVLDITCRDICRAVSWNHRVGQDSISMRCAVVARVRLRVCPG